MTRRRRQFVAAVAVLAAGAIVAALLATRNSDGASTRTTSPATVRAALITRLRTAHLRYRWVVCVPTGRRFRSQSVVRCNVDFGEPHIEAYCSIIDHGRLVTDHETPSFTCREDLRGWTTTVVTGP